MRLECDVAVVGGGVLGVTTAYWLSELYDCSVTTLDKSQKVAQHSTLRNTGLVHRPFYLDPVRKKLFARSAEKSYQMWKRLATEFALPWKEHGTIMVATDDRQSRALEDYAKWGAENGMSEDECQILDANGAKKLEPAVRCRGAILSKRDASTDYAALTAMVWNLASNNGAKFVPTSRVKSVEAAADNFVVTFGDDRSLSCSLLINLAGGGALDIARMMGLAKEYADLHFRGEYWVVDEARTPRVSRNVYSVARHPEFPFLDPHFIIRASGRREVGPNAALVSGPDAYEGLGLGKLISKLAERPLAPKARLFSNRTFLSLVLDEWRSSLSKRAMCERVRRFIPSLQSEMLVARGLPGVRSSLIGREGFVDEAVILEDSNSMHVLNYNSPGATGAPVFSAYVTRKMEEQGLLDGFPRKPSRKALWDWDSTLI